MASSSRRGNQRILRHASIATTERYMNVAQAHVKAGAEVMTRVIDEALALSPRHNFVTTPADPPTPHNATTGKEMARLAGFEPAALRFVA